MEVMRHRIEALVDAARELALAAREHVAHRLDAHGGLRLQPRDLGHLRIGRSRVAGAGGAQGHHGQNSRQRRQHDNGHAGDQEESHGHITPQYIDSQGTVLNRG